MGEELTVAAAHHRQGDDPHGRVPPEDQGAEHQDQNVVERATEQLPARKGKKKKFRRSSGGL